jgi:hypothetical protein
MIHRLFLFSTHPQRIQQESNPNLKLYLIPLSSVVSIHASESLISKIEFLQVFLQSLLFPIFPLWQHQQMGQLSKDKIKFST